MYPDVSGRTVVWMDLRRAESSAQTPTIDIYALDLDTMTETPVATDPPAYRIQPRIDGRNVVWTDYRYGQGEIYWENLDSGIAVPVGASAADESVADISGNSIAYSQQVIVDSYGYPIYNIFAQELLPNASVGVHTFTDVDNSYWAWAWIEAVAAKGVALGYSDGTYGPTLQVTRDQMAVYIARALAGGDSGVTTPVTTKFSDVPADYWANKYIAYCVNAGVVQGYPDGTYEPTTVVTRDAMAVFISRAVAGGDAEVSGPATVAFSDVPTSQWAYTYIEYCANPTRGIVQGYSDGTYRPGDPVTRDQMAVFISRAFKYTTD
jgi:beta propeller repeat protein